MKKILIALALGIVLVLAFATVAFADNGPHGSFTATTDACASCHRIHSAQFGSNALLIMDPEALCLSCHDGLGAGTNVEDGVYMQSGSDAHTGVAGGAIEGTDGASLFGGGFVNTLMATAWSGAATANPAFNAISRPATSRHDVGVTGTVWGSGAVNTPSGSMILECTSCHDPHGTAGYTNATASTTVCNPALLPGDPCTKKIASYRLLRWQPQGSGGFNAPATAVNWSGGVLPTGGTGASATSGWTVPDNFAVIGTEWYTLGTTGAFAVGDYNAGNANNVYNLKNATAAEVNTYIPAAVNQPMFCGQCHDRYLNNSRLRNNTDASVYCGNPLNGTTPLPGNATLFYPYLPDVDGVAPYIHPVDPIRCQAVVSATTGLITGWGDNGDSGDAVYMYRHASGDIRLSMDQSTAAGTGATVSRACAACHVSHGTSSAMTSLASDATLTAVAGNDVNNSTLLRMDNRSLCLRCHASTVNFTVAP